MGRLKSLDPYKQIIAALLSDAQALHSEVFSPSSLRKTTQKVIKRIDEEGISFLTKALPRLGKSLDRALSGTTQLDSVGFSKRRTGSKLPKFLGELFQCVFSEDGWVLPTPCVTCIATLREILFVFYKLDISYRDSEEEKVICQFLQTEVDILPFHETFSRIADSFDSDPSITNHPEMDGKLFGIVRKARISLQRLFHDFDPRAIHPKHGPGAVSTRERLEGKYVFDRINPRIEQVYPFDAYYTASLGHICDDYRDIQSKLVQESSARVLLVPKDSRGPRLISCEPLEFQWVQQGLGQAIVKHVEHSHLTMYNVHFTNQQSNQFGALLGSSTGRYATLDLKEASDRITVGLVRMLFPEPLRRFLLACRSESTELPSGVVIKLNKFAPMGSALCFPILALSIWALLHSSMSDADARESILVYGDDVIVPTDQTVSAIETLESFGLLINRDKSYSHGFFRESCGVDAYKGKNVTPCRIKTKWTSHPSHNTYTSYIDYSNNLRRKGYFNASDVITGWLCDVYHEIPSKDMNLSCPCLDVVPESNLPRRRRWNKELQKFQYLVFDTETRPVYKCLPGWLMLLRFFAERDTCDPLGLDIMPSRSGEGMRNFVPDWDGDAFSVRLYTRRDTSKLVKRWR